MPIVHASDIYPDLVTSFWRTAHWTWERRRVAKQIGFPFSEETITETILLDLATQNRAEIQIQPLTKYQESQIGADWEWCFYNEGGNRFFRTLVQAKVLDNLDAEYAHIDRKIGNTGVRQIDRLLRVARDRGVPALYVFYNHLADVSRVPVKTCQCYECRDCWGCSVALATDVEAHLPDKSFDTLRKISMPWLCLLCPGQSDAFPADTTPDRVAVALELLAQRPMAVDMASPPRASGFRNLIRSEPPPYFDEILRLPHIEEEARRVSAIEALAAENPGIAGIVLITNDKETSEP